MSTGLHGLAVVAGIVGVGAIDWVTGADIHVVSLYFVPLAFAAWHFGRRGAALSSPFAALVWCGAQYLDAPLPRAYILLANFVTQGAAFLTISMLVAVLGEALRREHANSRTDSLTGLKNRLAFVEQAHVAFGLCRRHRRPSALAYIDLDNFKTVNDSLGHAAGDALLQRVGSAITRNLRSTDIAARLGGDEFVVFLPETAANQAMTLVDALAGALRTSLDSANTGVTASVGVVVDGSSLRSVEQLLAVADERMLGAKREGKNRIQLHDWDLIDDA